MKLAARLSLVCAALICGAWVWVHYCYFPWQTWNDLRLGAALMMLHGESVYPMPGEGVMTTWVYGPVPLWLWAPAGLAPDAASALLTAGAFNIGYTFLAGGLTIAYWPASDSSASIVRRVAAGLLCIAIWPARSWEYITSDNATVALGLASNLALVASRNEGRWSWISAALAAGAVGCKQTSIGLVAAQVIWLVGERGARPALGHGARVAACGAALLLALASNSKLEGAFHNMVILPSQFPYTTELGERIRWQMGVLLLHVALPIAGVALTRGRWFRNGHPLRLPVMTWLCTLPTSLLGLAIAGGNSNVMISGLLLLPPWLAYVAASAPHSRQAQHALMAGCVAIAVVALKWQLGPSQEWLPKTRHITIATRLSQQVDGTIWFPWNTCIAHYIYGRFFHDEDGIYVRTLVGQPPSLEQLKRGLPSNVRHALIPEANWDIAPAIAGRSIEPARLAGTPWLLYSLPVQAHRRE